MRDSSKMTLLAHDFAAAIEVGDERRAYEAACALSALAGRFIDDHNDGSDMEDYSQASSAAVWRCKIPREKRHGPL